jgi:hypothetical protein
MSSWRDRDNFSPFSRTEARYWRFNAMMTTGISCRSASSAQRWRSFGFRSKGSGYWLSCDLSKIARTLPDATPKLKRDSES